jgi:hypothetical protein
MGEAQQPWNTLSVDQRLHLWRLHAHRLPFKLPSCVGFSQAEKEHVLDRLFSLPDDASLERALAFKPLCGAAAQQRAMVICRRLRERVN